VTFSFKANAVGEQSVEKTLLILSYEASKVAKCALEAQIVGPRGYVSAMLTEVGDCISMLRYYCELIKFDLEEPNAMLHNVIAAWVERGQLETRIYVAVGDLIQSHHYAAMFGTTLYHTKLDVCIANLRYLLRQWCFENNTTWGAVAMLGEEHYLERMEHLRREGVEAKRATDNSRS
jgi:hypothetical protein